MEPEGPPPPLKPPLISLTYDDLVKRIIHLEKEIKLLKILIEKNKLA